MSSHLNLKKITNDTMNIRQGRFISRFGCTRFVRHFPLLLMTTCLFTFYLLYNNLMTNEEKKLEEGPVDRPIISSFEDYVFPPSKMSKTPWIIRRSNGSVSRLKTILYWNEFYGRYDTYDFGYGHEAFIEKGCEVSECFTTKDRGLMSIDEFDAIIIHIQGRPKDLPERRDWDNQKYVMLAIEAPIFSSGYPKLNYLHFNWTMTYRLDSDFPIPYAWIDKTRALPTNLPFYIEDFGRKKHNLLRNKTGLIAQLRYPSSLSYCADYSSSKSESFIKELSRYVNIDIYGECGDLSCHNGNNNLLACYSELGSKYKFLLSFERTDCKDYVTEGFYTALDLDLIPVILGNNATNYSAFAPHKSFIDAAKFESPKALANHLKFLDRDENRYNEYFWWKNFYKKGFHHHRSMCDLCAHLNRKTSPVRKSYLDVKHWWLNESNCFSNYKHF